MSFVSRLGLPFNMHEYCEMSRDHSILHLTVFLAKSVALHMKCRNWTAES